MGLIEKLVETYESKEMKKYKIPFGTYEDFGLRMLKGLKISDEINLSIQASYGHYCYPRKTLPLEEYEAMELAIFKNGEFVNVKDVTNNEIIATKINKYYEGTVYGYVPVELLEELHNDLTINFMEENLAYHQMLARYTKQSVKLNKHLANIRLWEETIADSKEEYVALLSRYLDNSVHLKG